MCFNTVFAILSNRHCLSPWCFCTIKRKGKKIGNSRYSVAETPRHSVKKFHYWVVTSHDRLCLCRRHIFAVCRQALGTVGDGAHDDCAVLSHRMGPFNVDHRRVGRPLYNIILISDVELVSPTVVELIERDTILRPDNFDVYRNEVDKFDLWLSRGENTANFHAPTCHVFARFCSNVTVRLRRKEAFVIHATIEFSLARIFDIVYPR